MARAKRAPVAGDELVCLGIVRAAQQQCAALAARGAAPAAPVHGNTRLTAPDVLVVLLAAFFNPTCRSLRLIEQLSQVPWVNQRLGLDRVARSTLSDALARFDPEHLRPLIRRLMDQVPGLNRIDPDLQGLCKQVLVADGSMFDLAADVLWALHANQTGRHKCRVNLQLDLHSFTPAALSVSGNEQGSEAAAFIPDLKRGVIYVVDRNFVHFEFIGAVLDRDSDIVLRLRADTNFRAERDLPLGAGDVEAGVVRDQLGVLPGSGSRTGRGRTRPPPERTLRRIAVTDPETGAPLVLLTSLLGVDARVIAVLYRRRWQIELFLRWLKVWAGMSHLISHSKAGITTQLYVAVIGCLLMHVRTGRTVDKYLLFQWGLYVTGQIGFEQMLGMLARVDREKALTRARQAARAARKKLPA